MSDSFTLQDAAVFAARAQGLKFTGVYHEGDVTSTKTHFTFCEHGRKAPRFAGAELLQPTGEPLQDTAMKLAKVRHQDGREFIMLIGVCAGGVLHYSQVK